jgi:hypothetical protein
MRDYLIENPNFASLLSDGLKTSDFGPAMAAFLLLSMRAGAIKSEASLLAAYLMLPESNGFLCNCL